MNVYIPLKKWISLVSLKNCFGPNEKIVLSALNFISTLFFRYQYLWTFELSALMNFKVFLIHARIMWKIKNINFLPWYICCLIKAFNCLYSSKTTQVKVMKVKCWFLVESEMVYEYLKRKITFLFSLYLLTTKIFKRDKK